MSSEGGSDWVGGGGGSWGGGSGGDGFTEVTSQGWLSRIGGALVAIPVGLLLFAGSFVLLFWNEGRSVKTQRSLEEGKGVVVSVGADRVDPARQGKLVHVTGPVTTEQTLKDPRLGVSAHAIRLQRVVNMYQWEEKKQSRSRKKLGGGQETVTTYSYSKGWYDHPIDSSRFKEPGGHENPSSFPYEGWSADADDVRLGAFRLPPDLVSQIKRSEPLPVGESELQALPPEVKERVKLDGGRFYLGEKPGDPEVGDLTVEFRQVRPTTVSLLARQAGDSFEPFPTQAGDTINRLQVGTASAESMFASAAAENTVFTWLLRLVGFVLMAVGIGLVLRPLSVFADVVPFVGSLVGMGTGLIAIGGAMVLSLVTIALGWIVYRPLVGLSVLALAALAFFAFYSLARGRRGRAPGPKPAGSF